LFSIAILIVVRRFFRVIEFKGALTNRFIAKNVTTDAFAQDGQSKRALERILFCVQGPKTLVAATKTLVNPLILPTHLRTNSVTNLVDAKEQPREHEEYRTGHEAKVLEQSKGEGKEPQSQSP
jgi:hypothetical protein